MTEHPTSVGDPFFLLGFYRSGTTMLRLMLNAHSELAVPHETDFLIQDAPQWPGNDDLSDLAARAAAIDSIAANRFAAGGGLVTPAGRAAAMETTTYPAMVDALFTAYAHGQGKRIWGDKTPGYMIYVGRIARMFPRARFVHLVRDGRDVAVSHRGTRWGTHNIVKIAVKWSFAVQLADKVGTLLGDRYLRLRYEDLVADPATEVGRICAFLGVAYEPAMLDFHRTAEREMPEESLRWHRNSVSAPDPTRAAVWRDKLSEAEVQLFQEYAADALTRFGYPIVPVRRSIAVMLGKAHALLRGGRTWNGLRALGGQPV